MRRFLALALLLTPLASAQEDEASELEPADEAPLGPAPSSWNHNLTVIGHHFFAADLDEGPGDLAIQQAEVRFSMGRSIGAKRYLGLSVRHERSFYHFEDGAGIAGFVDPFNELNLASVGASLSTRESEDVSWMVRANASLGYEDGAELEDGLTFGGGGTVTWRVSSTILMTVGAFGNTRLEEDPLVYPWLQFDWQPTERLHVGQEGSGIGVGYVWMDDLTGYANFSFVERNLRLADDAPVPDGVLRDDEFAVNTGLIWDPEESPWNIELYGGVAFRELSLLDEDSELGDVGVDPSPYVALRVSYRL